MTLGQGKIKPRSEIPEGHNKSYNGEHKGDSFRISFRMSQKVSIKLESGNVRKWGKYALESGKAKKTPAVIGSPYGGYLQIIPIGHPYRESPLGNLMGDPYRKSV